MSGYPFHQMKYPRISYLIENDILRYAYLILSYPILPNQPNIALRILLRISHDLSSVVSLWGFCRVCNHEVFCNFIFPLIFFLSNIAIFSFYEDIIIFFFYSFSRTSSLHLHVCTEKGVQPRYRVYASNDYSKQKKENILHVNSLLSIINTLFFKEIIIKEKAFPI